MSNPVSNRMYEVLGRATWAVGKRKLRQRVTGGMSARYMVIGALLLGVIGIGAIAARANGGH